MSAARLTSAIPTVDKKRPPIVRLSRLGNVERASVMRSSRCRVVERAKLVVMKKLIAIICTNLINFGNTFLLYSPIFSAHVHFRAANPAALNDASHARSRRSCDARARSTELRAMPTRGARSATHSVPTLHGRAKTRTSLQVHLQGRRSSERNAGAHNRLTLDAYIASSTKCQQTQGRRHDRTAKTAADGCGQRARTFRAAGLSCVYRKAGGNARPDALRAAATRCAKTIAKAAPSGSRKSETGCRPPWPSEAAGGSRFSARTIFFVCNQGRGREPAAQGGKPCSC